MGLKGKTKTAGKIAGLDASAPSIFPPAAMAIRHAVSIALGIAFTVILVFLLGIGNPPLPYRRGQVAKADIRARVPFSFTRQPTDAERSDAAAKVPNIYVVDRSTFDQALDNLKTVLAFIRASDKFDAAKAAPLGITQDLFTAMKESTAGVSDEEIIAAASGAFETITRQGCMPAVDYEDELNHPKPGGIIIVDGPARRSVPLSAVVREEALSAAFGAALRNNVSNTFLATTVTNLLQPYLKPILSRDTAASEAAKKAASDAVQPVTVSYAMGANIVRGDSLIDDPQIDALQTEQAVYFDTMQTSDRMLRLLGLAITVTFLVWVFAWFVLRYEKRVLQRRARMVVLMLLAIILVLVARAFVQSSLSWYLIPLSFFSMTVAVAYNPPFALAYALFLAILVGIAAGDSFALAVTLFLGAITGILFIGRVRSRTTPFLAGIAAGVGTFVAACGTGLLLHADMKLTAQDSSYGLVSGIASGVIVTILLPYVERGFNIVTELSLLELVDLNKPVLRRMALEAPGTYNHSLFVGNLADGAAETIGANRLLARAGGYYHDLGKLAKPDYFVENRGAGASKHHTLSPTMSALVIISHVKDAVEMAREYRLPPPLIDIIREHHGTTLVEYFYREAIEKMGEASVEDHTFRYPGPKPRTREAAIVMLADSVESASRTITDPTPGKLESLVVDISRGKLADGQFDECNLTLYELRQIEISLTKSLAGIFHSRIKYPGREV